ncbi:MAG: acetyl-CoA carboxylase biotin carboxyl carrier protein [Deltaproteobacteria bacterium]|jgi:acetyl-CoA carboxylase biotin carboxyl carrier protein|nr:acetyl-CoA carboxylase biotin carboxyl carrier protein [Deltaproteobacteria bacterium]
MRKRKALVAGAKKASPASRQEPECGSKPLDLDRLRELAELATEFDLAEIELDAYGGVRVTRRAGGALVPAAPLLPPPPPVHVAPPPDKSAKVSEPGALLTSPFVGTFYRAPAPEAPPFVDVGQTVRKGQVVCIVEAMKLMNEIESEFDGKILEILVKNAEHVEYGQPLFRIDKA